MVSLSLKAAEILANEGISAEVRNLRSITPLERATINTSVRRTNRLVVVEEGFPQHGVVHLLSRRALVFLMHLLRGLLEPMFPCHMPSHRLKILFMLQREHATDLYQWPRLPNCSDNPSCYACWLFCFS